MDKVNQVLNEFGEPTSNLAPNTNQTMSTKSFNASEFARVLKYCEALKEQKIDITSPYPAWVAVAYAFIDSFGETGRIAFHMVSSAAYPGYNEKDTDAQYTACLKGDNPLKKDRIKIGTFYELAKKAGFTFRTSTSRESKNRDHQSEAFEVINNNYDIRYDLLNQDILVNGKPFDEYTLNTILIDLNVNHKIKVKKDFVQSVIESSFTKTTNQFIDFIDKYKDRTPSRVIDRLADTVVSKTGSKLSIEYKRTMFKLFFVKLVAQALDNVPNDLCLVFLGQKFLGKTYFFNNLLPAELQHLFSTQSFKNDKDFRRDGARYLLILDDEFKYLRVATNELIKSLLSATTVTVRVPYARKPVAYKRIASYCISSNERFILKDHTGNRRLICWWVDQIKWDEFNMIDKIDLLIESYHLYKSGFDHVLTNELLEAIETVSSEFEETSSAEELLKRNLPPGELIDTKKSFWWPCSRIIKEINDTVGQRLSDYEVGKALRKLSYRHKFLDVNGSKLCCWLMKFGEANDDIFNNTPDFIPTVTNVDFGQKPEEKPKSDDGPIINDLPPLDELT